MLYTSNNWTKIHFSPFFEHLQQQVIIHTFIQKGKVIAKSKSKRAHGMRYDHVFLMSCLVQTEKNSRLYLYSKRGSTSASCWNVTNRPSWKRTVVICRKLQFFHSLLEFTIVFFYYVWFTRVYCIRTLKTVVLKYIIFRKTAKKLYFIFYCSKIAILVAYMLIFNYVYWTVLQKL